MLKTAGSLSYGSYSVYHMCRTCPFAGLTFGVLACLSIGFSSDDDTSSKVLPALAPPLASSIIRSNLAPQEKHEPENKKQVFFREVQAAIDEVRGGTRVKHFEEVLASVYSTLPREESGQISNAAVRFALNLLLAPQQESHSIDTITAEAPLRKVPAKLLALYVQEYLEQYVGRTNLDASDIALVVATVERLLNNKIVERFGEKDIRDIVSTRLREMNKQSVEINDDASIHAVALHSVRERPQSESLPKDDVNAIDTEEGMFLTNEIKVLLREAKMGQARVKGGGLTGKGRQTGARGGRQLPGSKPRPRPPKRRQQVARRPGPKPRPRPRRRPPPVPQPRPPPPKQPQPVAASSKSQAASRAVAGGAAGAGAAGAA